MGTHGLKSGKKHPYQKGMIPFWRHSNLPPTMGYSEESKHEFEIKKIEYDQACKYYQWVTK